MQVCAAEGLCAGGTHCKCALLGAARAGGTHCKRALARATRGKMHALTLKTHKNNKNASIAHVARATWDLASQFRRALVCIAIAY